MLDFISKFVNKSLNNSLNSLTKRLDKSLLTPDFIQKRVESAFKFAEKYELNVKYIALFLFFAPQALLWYFFPDILLNLVVYLVLASPVLFLLYTIGKAKEAWDLYKRVKFLDSQDYVLLKIDNVEDITKGPKAMELFFESIHIKPGESTFIATKLKGGTRPWWSFEIVSFEGEIKFYIWTWKKFADFVKTQLLAQFPRLEIREVPDYMDNVMWDENDKFDLWGSDFGLTKKDAFPIKTYVDFGLDSVDNFDKDRCTDPLDNVFEKLKSLKEGELLILHIYAQVSKNSKWKKEVEEVIEEIYKKRTDEYPSFHDPNTKVKGMPLLRPQDMEEVQSLNRSLEKNAFDVGIRAVYFAKKGKIDAKKFGTHIVHLYRSFADDAHNYLLGAKHWFAGYDYPWSDYFHKERKSKREKIIKALKYRSYFHPPVSFDPIVLTTEELASIFHFPSNTQKGASSEKFIDEELLKKLPM